MQCLADIPGKPAPPPPPFLKGNGEVDLEEGGWDEWKEGKLQLGCNV